MTDPTKVPLPASPVPSPARSPFSPIFSPTSNHPISPLTFFTPLPSGTPQHSHHASSGPSRQHTGGSSTPYHAQRPSIAPSDSVSTAPSRRSSSFGVPGATGTSFLRSVSPAGQGPFRPRLDRHATIRRDMGASVMQQPQDPFYEGVTIEVNQPVGSLSISPSNRDVCLASRKGLYIIDLANLHNAPRFVPQGGTWQIADCQWSPHPATSNMILSTSSQKLLVWDLAAQVALRHSVDAHARAITDINWHARDPNLMATASMDAGIRGWDLRCLDRPYMRVCAWGEAVTQIKWNRQHDHLFATAHGKEVLIWDNRKGSVPVVNWKAHDSKIYGIDWDREHRHKLVTCSLDQTVKYWTVSDLRTFGDKATHTFYPKLSPPAQASSVVKTGYPVWRARNLPFGHGVIALPQRGGEDLEMFALGNDKPVHTFEGHTNVVKDFVWRSRGGDDAAFENREFQLVTWSKDQTLRIWPVPRDVTESVGYQYGAPITVLVSRRGAKDITYTTTHRADDKQVVPMPIVNQPSGLSKTRNAPLQSHGHHKEVGGMTRGGKKVKVVDQLDWLTKVIKNKASPEASAWQSRIGSVSARGSRSGSRERMRGVSQGPGLDRSATIGSSVTGGESMSLKDEIVIVNQLFPRPKVRFAKIDLHHKKLTMEMSGPWANGDRMAFCRIHWSFPAEYPNCTEIPTFELERNPTVSQITRQKLVMTLKEIRAADKQCLVQTCAFLLGHHEVSRAGKGRRLEEDSDSESETGSATGLRPIGGKTGTNVVMMIRNCGATFGPNGQLVCFFPKRTVLPRIRPLGQNPAAINTYASQATSAGREPPTLIKAMSALSSLSRTGAQDPRSHPRSRLALRRAQMGITLGVGAALGFTDNSMSTVQAGSTVTIHSVEMAHRHQGALASTAGTDGFSKVLAKEYGVPTHLRDIERMVRVAEKHKRIDHLLVLHALWGAIGSYEPHDDEMAEDGRVSPPPPYSEVPEASGSRERWEYSLTRRKAMVDQVFQTLMDNRDIQMLALASILVLLHVRSDPPPPHLLDPRDQVTMVSPVQDYFGLPLPRNHSALSQPTANPRSRSSMYANSQGFPSPLMTGGPTSAPGHGLTNVQYDRHSRGSSAPHPPLQTGQSGQWSFHPSSASLRALGAMTPRDRGSFDALARTPFGMSVDFTSPQLPGTGQSAVPASVWAGSLMGKGKSPRALQYPHRQASVQHRDSDLGVQIQERPRHPVMGRRQRINSRAATAPKEGDESGAETPRAHPRSAEGTGDLTPVVRPNSVSGSAFAGAVVGTGASASAGAGSASAFTYGQSGIYATTGIAPLRSAGTDKSYTSGNGNGSYGRSGFQNSLPRGEQEVGSAGSVKWFGSPAKRKSTGPAPGASQMDMRNSGKGEREGVKANVPHKICGVRIEVIQPGQDRFDNDARHVPIGYPQYTPALQSVSATLLPPERLVQCDIWRNVYADLLLRSELYVLRAEVLQYDFVQPHETAVRDTFRRGEEEAESGIACVTCVEVGRECCSCEKRVGARAARCSYCRLPIRGLFTTCTLCAHRTHLACFRLHTGIDRKGPNHPAASATCAACPCRCLPEGGLTGAVIPYGPPPPLALDTSMLPYDESGMISDIYPVADVSNSPEMASNIVMPMSATPAQPPSGIGADQFPFPSTRRPAERGLSGLRGAKGAAAGGRRSGASGSPRRSVSQSGFGTVSDGHRSASSSGIVRLGRAGTASAAPPAAASSHARGLANMGAIGGGSGVGLGLGLKSVAEGDVPVSPGVSTVPAPLSGGEAVMGAGAGASSGRGAGRGSGTGRGRTRGRGQGDVQASPTAPVRGETRTSARGAIASNEARDNQPSSAHGEAPGAGQKVWSSIYGYANPYANFQTPAPAPAPAAQAAAHRSSAGHGQAGGNGHDHAGQAQAQGAQGLLARARAAMDAGGAWR